MYDRWLSGYFSWILSSGDILSAIDLTLSQVCSQRGAKRGGNGTARPALFFVHDDPPIHAPARIMRCSGACRMF